MEAVKDTLWTWAIQLGALAGLGLSAWAVWACSVELGAEPERDATMLIAGTILLGPLLGIACLRMLLLRRWAGWAVLALTAWSVCEAATSQWAGRAGWLSASLLMVAALGYTLLLRPRIWRGGW